MIETYERASELDVGTWNGIMPMLPDIALGTVGLALQERNAATEMRYLVDVDGSGAWVAGLPCALATDRSVWVLGRPDRMVVRAANEMGDAKAAAMVGLHDDLAADLLPSLVLGGRHMGNSAVLLSDKVADKPAMLERLLDAAEVQAHSLGARSMAFPFLPDTSETLIGLLRERGWRMFGPDTQAGVICRQSRFTHRLWDRQRTHQGVACGGCAGDSGRVHEQAVHGLAARHHSAQEVHRLRDGHLPDHHQCAGGIRAPARRRGALLERGRRIRGHLGVHNRRRDHLMHRTHTGRTRQAHLRYPVGGRRATGGKHPKAVECPNFQGVQRPSCTIRAPGRISRNALVTAVLQAPSVPDATCAR